MKVGTHTRVLTFNFLLTVSLTAFAAQAQSQSVAGTNALHPQASSFGKFSKLPHALTYGRSGHNCEVIDASTLLIAGGAWGDLGGENKSEILNLRTLKVSTLPDSHSRLRSGATQAKLNDGRLLLIGGSSDFETALETTDFFNPKSNTFSPGPDMNKSRSGHASVAFTDGRVMVFGGEDSYGIHDTIEVYSPSTGTFSVLSTHLKQPRTNHTATLINNRVVALIGGETGPSEADPQRSAQFLSDIEFFDLESMTMLAWNPSMQSARIYHTASPLSQDRVLISGGLMAPAQSSNQIEILDFANQSISLAGIALHARSLHTLSLLADGSFLMAGGVEDGRPLKDTERCKFISVQEVNCEEAPQLSQARWGHTATSLPDGQVLFIGGLTNTPEKGQKRAGPLHGLELYKP